MTAQASGLILYQVRDPPDLTPIKSGSDLRRAGKIKMRNKSKGFTLIELLLVMAIIFIGMSVGTTSFMRYSKSQDLTQASADVVSLLNNARINAVTQTLPQPIGACTPPPPPAPLPPINLQYIVRITSPTAYEMNVYYNGVCSKVKTGKLPSGVTFTLVPNEIYFLTATGTSPAGGAITLNGTYGSKQITIDVAGNITKQ